MFVPLQKGVPPASGLERVAPGLYVDDLGVEYFYLTGIYASVARHVLNRPLLNTPAFIANVLGELRYALQDRSCLELTD
jgi:hypothetical protein